MKEFLNLAWRFRSTPIVDDDFGYLRDKFDNELCRLRKKMPKIVCLCGSTKFMHAFQQANLTETVDYGNIVLSVGCNTKSDAGLQLGADTKKRLDDLHKRKIDLADEILVLNVGGYIGESTQSEIEYAEALGKPIRYLIPSQLTDVEIEAKHMQRTVEQEFNERFQIGQNYSLWELNDFIEKNKLDVAVEANAITVTLHGSFLGEFTRFPERTAGGKNAL